MPENKRAAWEKGQHVLLADELLAWQERIDGKRKRLPNGFWGADRSDSDGWARGLACARYLFEERLALTREALLGISGDDIIRYCLGGFKIHWNCSIHAIVSGAYPELDIQPWEMRHVAHDYWLTGGREAKLAALRWWLEKRGITAAEAYHLIATHQGTTIQHQIEQATNLVESGDYIALLELFQEIDPSIEPYLGRRKQRDTSNDYSCPLCARSVRQITQHLMRDHGLGATAARDLIAKSLAPASGFVTSLAIAAQLGVYAQTVTKAAREGRLTAQRVGDIWWIDISGPEYAEWCQQVQKAPRHRGAQGKHKHP